MSKTTRTYTEEFKQEAVALALRLPSVSAAANSLGIPDATLHTWVNKAKASGDCAVTAANGVSSKVNVGAMMDENKSLHKRIAELEQEKAILKKAATYFAKEPK